MKISFLEKLVCPFDKHDLSIKIFKYDAENISEGLLTCSSCNRYYPIVHGIPIMSPDEYREINLELPMLTKWGERLLPESNASIFRLVPQTELQEEGSTNIMK